MADLGHRSSSQAGQTSGTPQAQGRVRAGLPVDLPAPRDQITAKELPAFVRLRTR